MTLGNRLKIILKINNLSQKELAQKIGATECSISKYCNDKRKAHINQLNQMAKVLNVSLDELIGNCKTFDLLLEKYEMCLV